jgi:DNA repair protein RadA/Sms
VAKIKTQYVCQQCGKTTAKPLGRCPQCGAWASMVEEVVSGSRSQATSRLTGTTRPSSLVEVEERSESRVPVGIEEFARVLGGGIVPGSLVLIGGDPGIGKSTLLLQMALQMAGVGSVLYISGEESNHQVKSRALRILGDTPLPEQMLLYPETDLNLIQETILEIRPSLVVIDSIQTITIPEINSSAGSIVQVRESAARFQDLAKSEDIPIFLVGHVTKDGSIAGPRVLEHIVDTVLYLEGDHYHAFRLLRSVKNRFGATSEVGVFEMLSRGMVEVPNPSERFLAERVVKASGSAIAVVMEGTRPLLVEVQGLTSQTSFGNPRRTANGIDYNRLLLITAVLIRRAGLRLADEDIFVNVVGGMRINEPAADLAVAAALYSSTRDVPVPADIAVIGEIGLSGELRSVSQLETRLKEASKLGFRRVLIPASSRLSTETSDDMELLRARSVADAFRLIFPEKP